MIYKKCKYGTIIEAKQADNVGHPIEEAISLMMLRDEEIVDMSAKLIYQERDEGVMPGYNIRADKWEIALEAMEKAVTSKKGSKEAKEVAKEIMAPESGGLVE